MGLKQAEKTGKPENLSPQAWKDLTFAAVTKALLHISAKKPTILFIDDLHWVDSASLALLHYISRAIINQRVLMLATFRSEALSPNAEGLPHPLVEALRLMRREDLFKEIKLPNLSLTYVSAIAENALGGSLAPEFAEKLARESHGNPLFIVESLRMLSERGRLVQDRGQWHFSVDELGIPTKIRDIILQRVSVLKPNQRRVLDLASVIGEKFDVELLGAVLGQDSLEVLETLNSIAQSSSLVVCEGESYRFDHEKSREAIYEEISLPLKRGYHARIAEKIENASQGAKEISLSNLAYHYAQSGNKKKSVKYSLAAGQDALARFSNPEAIKHFKDVLQTTANLQGYSSERKVALEELGDAYYANCMFEEAVKTFENLASSETGLIKLRAYRKEMDALWYTGYDAARLMKLVKKAEKYAASDRLERARILWNRARALNRMGDLTASLKDHEEALQISKEEYSLPDMAQLLAGTGITRIQVGLQPERGLGELQRSIALYQELGDDRGEINATVLRHSAFQTYGLFSEIAGELVNITKIGEKIGDFEDLALVTLWRSYALELNGRLAKSIAESLKAWEYSKKTDTRRLQGEIFAGLTRKYVKIGDLKQASHYLGVLMKMPPEILSIPRNAGLAALAEAVLFAAKAQWKEANQRFRRIIKEPGFNRHIGWVALCKDSYAWALDLQGRTEEAKIQRVEIKKRLEKAEQRFAHTNLQADLMMRRIVMVGEEIELRLDLVNVGKGASSIIRVKDFIPSDGFKVTDLPDQYCLQNGDLEIGRIEIGAFQVKTIKLNVQASKAGIFSLAPQLTYIDDLGETRTCKTNSVKITVQQAQPKFEVLPGRISGGFAKFDALLFGGIPENYAVILTTPSIDERALLAKKFLKAGANEGETTFYITVEAGNGKTLAEKYPTDFYFVLCNPQADSMVQNLPNVYKLKGVENLTEIDIALTKAFRTLKPSATGPKRIWIEIVSDVLLQHHAVITRKWLSGLLPSLKSKGFTIVAVINPQMHPYEELQAVLGLFDGEISLYEKETPRGPVSFLRIKRMTGQKYLKGEIPLTEE
jgi:tetratricopeptide (TPR) repeat protein/KaiC/GvpD/RAD55 family RecA-like ATPase